MLSEKTPAISVIICVSRIQSLRKCLDSLGRQQKKNLEIVLVLDPQGTLAFELPSALPIKTIIADSYHPARKRNLGVLAGNSQFIAFLDDDTVIPSSWSENLERLLHEYPHAVLGGPNRDTRQDFQFRVPQLIQEHPLLEGLKSHRTLSEPMQRVDFHNLPLCNLAVRKEIFEKIGGFNEEVTYFLDDVEFNFIAAKRGYDLLLFPELEIHHDLRPLFLPYFFYKYRTRKEIGRIFPHFPELYSGSKAVQLVFLSYLLLPLTVLNPQRTRTFLFFVFFPIYFLSLCLSQISARKNLVQMLGISCGVFFAHLFSYLGFTVGLFKGGWENFTGNANFSSVKARRFRRDS